MMGAELMEGMTKEEYHADPALSQSGIKDYIRDPQYFYQRYIARSIPSKPSTPSQEFGNAVEELAFEGRLNAVMIPPEVLNQEGHRKNRAGERQWTTWQDAQMAQHGPDVKLLKADEFSKPMGPAAIMQAVDNLRAHDFAKRMIWGETVRHVRIRWVDEVTGLECRCEIDLLQLVGVIGDLKTSRIVDPFGFARCVVQYGYDFQSFFYREALRKLAENRAHLTDSPTARAIRPLLNRIADGENLLCCWVAVKNSPSYHCEVHPVDEAWYTIAEPIIRQKMLEIAQARETGHWQTRTFGTITNMVPPKFAFNRIEELASTEE
jgi:hypothetical protein